MADKKKYIAQILIAAIVAASLTGCLRSGDGQPAETGGVGRLDTSTESSVPMPPLETEPGMTEETEAPSTTAPETEATITAPSYKIENGKYVYSFPTPDRSRMDDTTWLSSVSKALFSDQGDDTSGSWYFGKVSRNLTTGEVTYVWDRYADTLALLEKYNGIYRQNTDQRVCYFTFDCGYENGFTNPILDVLKEKNVPAIFFVTGDYVDSAPEQLRRMIDEGHIIGNHTENHYNATTISPEVFREEIESVERKMAEKYGYTDPMLYWRPPQGACNEYVLAMAEAMGLYTVLWSFTQMDYDPANQPDYNTALTKAKEGLHPGCVYLFHAVSETNAAMLGEFIDWVRAQGYEIRPLCG